MIIELANVGTTAKRIELQFDPVEIDLDGDSISLAGQAALDAELTGSECGAELNGQIRASVLLDCTRCLEPSEKKLAFEFRAIFVDSSQEDAAVEKELSDDALDTSFVEDGRIDLREVVREQILLAVPEQIFCREDCLGLCSKCGTNLNLIDCKCADDKVDPRWAALKNLK